MIRFQPRRVSNVIIGLTLFWCGILSIFFWIRGFNFNFLLIMLVMVFVGFIAASIRAEAFQEEILKGLGFDPSRKLLVTDRNAFSSQSNGVFSSIGPVPFQYTVPARLIPLRLKGDKFSELIQNKLPLEIFKSELFLEEFQSAIESSPHSRLIRAILEVYCHPDHINLPAGISRHNNEFLLTHCLRVGALMLHRVNDFKQKNFYVLANDESFVIEKSESLLLIVGFAHDLGKIDSFKYDANGKICAIMPNHHKSACRIVSTLPEFWEDSISSEERYIIQSCCIYSTDYAFSPIKMSLLENTKPQAVSDRLQHLIELTIECDILASQIENGVKYSFDTSPLLTEVQIPVDKAELLEDAKIDLFQKFSEFISTDAIINGKGSDRSVGFKYKDAEKEKSQHFLFIDESEFSIAFAAFLGRPSWANKDNKSRALTSATLSKLDEAGFLVRSGDVGAQPAVNCLYKVDFMQGEPLVVTFSLRSSFILDLTDWPNQNKIRNMATCHSKPVIGNSIFGNKFSTVRRSVTDSDVYEELGFEDDKGTVLSNIESLVKSKETVASKPKSMSHAQIITKIKSGLTKNEITPALDVAPGAPIPIANSDKFFSSLGIKVSFCEPPTDYLKSIGIVAIRDSKKNVGAHIIILDPTIYTVNAADVKSQQ